METAAASEYPPGHHLHTLLSRRTRHGPADHAIEIVARGSRLRNRGEMLAECEMGGVRGY